MPYEKFIKKDGKTYGPYIYHSKRIDGKIVSEYHGQKKQWPMKFIWIAVAALVILGAYLIGQKGETGYSILGINADYQEGMPLDGDLNFQLQQGELVPSEAKVIFQNAGQQYEYALEEIATGQSTQGDFFVVGKNISGSGSGFGLAGTKEFFPEVHFVLLLHSNLNGTDNTQSEKEVSGVVTGDGDFAYQLSEGETAELKPKSVTAEGLSGMEQLDDGDISVNSENNIVTVSTSYKENKQGFGFDYKGEEVENINIDLSSLNLNLEPGELNVLIIYDSQEIASLSTVIGSANDETSSEPTEEASKETLEENPMNATINITTTESEIPFINIQFTEEEQAVLTEEFGNETMAVSEATLKNGFITVRYGLGDFWIENSYDADVGNETLKAFVEKDKEKFLKDIAQSLLQTQEQPKAIPLP